jgi:hypothetical protein
MLMPGCHASAEVDGQVVECHAVDGISCWCVDSFAMILFNISF